jgi:hypothetical protein
MYDAFKLESGNISVHTRWESHKMAVQSFFNDTNALEWVVPIEIEATISGAYTLVADSLKALEKYSTFIQVNGNRFTFNTGDSITFQLLANEILTVDFVVQPNSGGPNRTSTDEVLVPFEVITTAAFCQIENHADEPIVLKEYNLIGTLIQTKILAAGELVQFPKHNNKLALIQIQYKNHKKTILY